MPLHLRAATPADHAAITAIVHAAYAPYIPRIGRRPGPMLDDYAARIAQRQIHVAERNGVLVGLLVLIPQPGAMLLDNVAVDPAAQGTGVGRHLLQAAEHLARQAGFRTIRLYTNQAMTENATLYARLGYHETHRAEEHGLHRIYMQKPLIPQKPTTPSSSPASRRGPG